MYSIFIIILFLSTFWFVSIISTLVTVGNYSQLNPKTCGLSRHSIGVDTNCFKWHKDILSPIRGAKNVTVGDSPWVVLLKISLINRNKVITCTGAIIGSQWITTAAHCLKEIYLKYHLNYDQGQAFPNSPAFDETDETHVHPDYDRNTSAYDIALVRMTKPIDSRANHLLVNSICLPQKWSGINDCYFKPTPNCERYEYGMVAGWGSGLHPRLNNSQIGFWRLYNYRYSLSRNPDNYPKRSKMPLNQLENQTICEGDSGGPVWQYDMGRAVIIGVLSTTIKDQMKCELSYNLNTWAIYVDQVTDWIKNETKLN